MKLRGLLYAQFILFVFLVVSCVTEFQPDPISIQPALVVEGQITDQPGPYTVKLTRTADYSYKSLNLGETGAIVIISDNMGNQETLKETSSGTYQTATTGIRGVVGRRYKLSIQTKAGKRYESQPEVLPAVPSISRVYSEPVYTPGTAVTAGKQTWNVYIDSKDPDTLGNYYKWNWTHYEFATVCKKTYVPSANNFNGIVCCSDCWDITRCYTCLNINSDQNINGKAISRQFISEVPFTSFGPYYIEVEQQSLSLGAYQFWKSVRQLTANTGGIFDAAPSTVQGNVHAITSPDEVVYGYFGVTGLSTTYLLVDRSAGQGAPSLDLPVNVQYPSNPPCVVCENSQYRTPIKPRWWQL